MHRDLNQHLDKLRPRALLMTYAQGCLTAKFSDMFYPQDLVGINGSHAQLYVALFMSERRKSL